MTYKSSRNPEDVNDVIEATIRKLVNTTIFYYNVIRTLQPWSAVPLPSHTNSINGISVSDLVFIWNPGILDSGTPRPTQFVILQLWLISLHPEAE